MISLGCQSRLSLIALAVGLAPTPALADALQQRVLAGTRAVSETDFSFTQTLVNQRSGEEAKEIVMRYDPKRAKGARWTLVRVEGRAPTAKELASVSKQAENGRVPSYAHIGKWFGSPATRVATTNDSVTYRFAALPKGTFKMGSHDASADSVGEAVVNTSGAVPFVERIRFTTGKPFRMMLVAKVNRVESTVTYRMLADGRAVPASANSMMTGSMMGKDGWFKSRVSYSDQRAAR